MLRLLAPRRPGYQCNPRAAIRQPSHAVCAINNRRQSNPDERGNLQAVKLHLAAQHVWAGKPLLESIASELVDSNSMHTSMSDLAMPVLDLTDKPRIKSQLVTVTGTNNMHASTSIDSMVQQICECVENDIHPLPLLTYNSGHPSVISLNTNNLLERAAQLLHIGQEPSNSVDFTASASKPVFKMAVARSASANTKVAVAMDSDASMTFQAKAAATMAATEPVMLPQAITAHAFSGPAFDSDSLQRICHQLFKGPDELNAMKLQVALHLIDVGEPIPWENATYKKQHMPLLAYLSNLKPKSKLAADPSECFAFTKEDGKELLGLNASKLIAAWTAHVTGKPITSNLGTYDVKPKQTAKSAAVLDAVNMLMPAGKPAAELIASLPVTAEPEAWLYDNMGGVAVTPITLPSVPAMVDTVFAGSEYTQQLKREAGLWIALTSASSEPSADDTRPSYALEWDDHGQNGLALTKGYMQARHLDQPETAKAVFEADLCFSFVHAAGREWLTLSTNALQMRYAQLTAFAFETSVPCFQGPGSPEMQAVMLPRAVKKRASPRRTTPALSDEHVAVVAIPADDVKPVRRRSSPRRTASPTPEVVTTEAVGANTAEEKVIKKRASRARSVTPAVVTPAAEVNGVTQELSREQELRGRAVTPEVTIASGIEAADNSPKVTKKRASSRRATPVALTDVVADVEDVTKAKAKRRASPRKASPAAVDPGAIQPVPLESGEMKSSNVSTRRRRSTSPPSVTECMDVKAVTAAPDDASTLIGAVPACQAVSNSTGFDNLEVAGGGIQDEAARVIAKAAALRMIHRVLRARSKDLQEQHTSA